MYYYFIKASLLAFISVEINPCIFFLNEQPRFTMQKYITKEWEGGVL